MIRPKGANGKLYCGVALLDKIKIFSAKCALVYDFPFALKVCEFLTQDTKMDIAIYCGASLGVDETIVKQVAELATYLAQQNIGLVYGGGNIGLMGVVADAALAANGKVIGVMPTQLEHHEIAHQGLTQLYPVKDMHERKAKMLELSDACVALPGGIGTLDEMFEAWTWGQLGYHSKPCAFYNVNGYFDKLFEMVNEMATAGFVRPRYLEAIIQANQPEQLVASLKTAGNKNGS